MSAERTAVPVHCHLCGAEVRRPWFTRGRATWWRCPGCGFLFVHPQPDQETLDRLYQAAYYGERREYTGKYLTKWRERVLSVESIAEPGHLLDVGCGAGAFLLNALARDWRAWGLEVSHDAISALPEPARSHAVVGRLESAPFADESLDALTLFDVIEHVRSPLDFLGNARRPLKPGGLLVITTPDAGSMKARIKRRFWRYFDFDRYLHLYHFSARTLTLALRKTGFEVTRWFRRRGTPLFVAARKL